MSKMISKKLEKQIKNSLRKTGDELEKYSGKANLVPFANHVMPNRGIMDSAAKDQYVEPINGEIPDCNTVYANDIYRSTENIFAKDGMEVLHIIPKFVQGERTCVTAYILLDKDEDKIYLYINEGFKETNENYGIHMDTHIEEEGQVLSKDDTIMRPHAFDEDGIYRGGVNANSMYLTSFETTEDAFMMDEKFMEKIANYRYYKFEHEFDLNNTVIKNLYGKEDEYQPFPLVGEVIENNPDNPYEDTSGFLMSYSSVASNSGFIRSNKSMMKISQDDTHKVYPNGAKVVDITVRQALDQVCPSEFLRELLEDNREFEREIYSLLKEYKNDGYNFSDNTQDKYLEYKYVYEKDYGYRRGKHGYIPKHKIIIDIKLVKINVPFVGQKFIGQHGNKGVCSVVLTDNDGNKYDMDNCVGVYKHGSFKDKDGTPIDFIMATPGVPNRGNTGQLNVRTTNQMATKFIRFLKTNDKYSNKEKVELLYLFTNIFSPKQSDAYKKLVDKHGEKEVLEYIYEKGIKWQFKPFSHGITLKTYMIAVDFFEELGVEYYDSNTMGKDVIYVNGEPKFEAEVGKLYIHLLKQDARKNMSIRSKGAYNMQNNVTRTRDKKRHTARYSSTPIKQSTDDTFLLMGMLKPDTVHQLFSTTESSIVETLNSYLTVLGLDIENNDG
jgi:hypothetical protein